VSLAYERRFQVPSEVLRLATRPASPVSACDERPYIAVEQSVWESKKEDEAQARKKVVNLVSEARDESRRRALAVRLVVGIDRHRAAQQPRPGDLGKSGEIFGNPAGSAGKFDGYSA
jgi:hypothetical protein